MLKIDEHLKRFTRRRITFMTVAIGGAILASRLAMAQSDFPNKPITSSSDFPREAV
jgi:hypothetical protein